MCAIGLIQLLDAGSADYGALHVETGCKSTDNSTAKESMSDSSNTLWTVFGVFYVPLQRASIGVECS